MHASKRHRPAVPGADREKESQISTIVDANITLRTIALTDEQPGDVSDTAFTSFSQDDPLLSAYPADISTPFLEQIKEIRDLSFVNPERNQLGARTTSFEDIALNHEGDVAFSAHTDAPQIWLGELDPTNTFSNDLSELLWKGNYIGETTTGTFGAEGVFWAENADAGYSLQLRAHEGQEIGIDGLNSARDSVDPFSGDLLPPLYYNITSVAAIGDDVSINARTTKAASDVRDFGDRGIFVVGPEDSRAVLFNNAPLENNQENFPQIDFNDYKYIPLDPQLSDTGQLAGIFPLNNNNSTKRGLYQRDEDGKFTKILEPGDTVEGEQIDGISFTFAHRVPDTGDILVGVGLSSVDGNSIVRLAEGEEPSLVVQNGDDAVDVNGDGTDESFTQLGLGAKSGISAEGLTVTISEVENPGPSARDEPGETEFLNNTVPDVSVDSLADLKGLAESVEEGEEDVPDFLDGFDNEVAATVLNSIYIKGLETIYDSATNPLPGVFSITADGQVEKLALRGEPVDGLDGKVFADFLEVHVNAGGSAAVLAEVTDAGTDFDGVNSDGDEIDVSTQTGVFVYDQLDDSWQKVVVEGDAIELSSGEERTVKELNDFDFNNQGQVAFSSEFENDSSGLFVTGGSDGDEDNGSGPGNDGGNGGPDGNGGPGGGGGGSAQLFTPNDDSVSLGDGPDVGDALAGDDIVYGNAGADSIVGNGGEDEIYGNEGDDEVYGNQGDDLVFGGQGDDLVFGGQDNDQVYGNKGEDQVYGNRGDDQLFGGQENDDLFGGQDNDLIYGNLGDDRIYGNKGTDTLFGGEGDDEFAFLSGDGQDTVADFSDGDTIAFQADINGSGAENFADLTITETDAGDAVIELGDGNSVTLQGVAADELSEADFSFF